MADVMSDISGTNGELKEDNDEIRMNGDKCGDPLESEEEFGSDDAANDTPRNEKVRIEVSAVSRLHDVEDKCPTTTIANGHLKSTDCADVKSKSICINSESSDLVDAKVGASSIAAAAASSADEQNEDLSAELENDDEEVEEDEEEEDDEDEEEVEDDNDCDSGPLNFAQSSKHSEEAGGDVLNLKADSSNISFSNNSSHNKHELRKTTALDEKTESSEEATVADLSEDRLQKSDDGHTADNSSGSSVDLNKTNDEHENDSLSSEGSSEKRKYVKKSFASANLTPRRSSRNLNKQKNYAEKEPVDIEAGASNSIHTSTPKNNVNEEDEIEEVTPTDPLADDPKARMRASKTIVVSDTKGLVEFASSAKMPRSNKKEPTLVIIDTNSILSGRGPVPISQSVNSSNLHSSSSSAPIPVSLPIPAGALSNASRGVPASTSAFSVIPIGIPAQSMYPHQYKNPPPQMKPIVVGPASTTVTPITIQSVSSSLNNSVGHSGGGGGGASVTVISGAGQVSALQQQTTLNSSSKQPPIILPSLTDDMFVVEAPSFIVPYVYEKPPIKSLKGYTEKLAAEVREAEEKERQEREEKEKLEKERLEKERAEAEEKRKEAADAEKADEAVAAVDEAEVIAAAASKDESMEVDNESNEKSTDKTSTESTTDSISDAPSASVDDATEKEASVLQMEVDEEVDPDASKVTSENDIVLTSSKKVDDAEATKKEEPAAAPSAVIAASASTTALKDAEKKIEDAKKTLQQPLSYFDNPLGKFFMQIGLNLVQEHVQTDLLRSQKRKRDKEGDKCSSDVKLAIETLSRTLESSKENNDPFKLELRKCELCSFKTESILVMAHHLETPHMKNYTYRCNFCPFEVRSPHDILFHMESEHNIRGRLERAPAFHQCPNCPFEDNQKGKLTRHMVSCSKKYRPERNQEPPLDWEPPAKIPRVTRNRPPSMSPGNAVYQAAMSGLKQVPQNSLLPKLIPTAAAANMKQPPNMINMNKRPNAVPPNFVQRFSNAVNHANFQQRSISVQGTNQGIMYRSPVPNSQTQVILPQNYQLSGAQIYQQNQNMKQQPAMQPGLAAAKLLNQPSISITPLPRQTPTTQPSSSINQGNVNMKPGKPPGPGSKNSFVVCEICDSGIKDLEQLRNHMQWIHKVKIHPKMIYNRPPLNCQKCQFRFFTDQGLERHLLGSHGLVTSSMQEAANKGKDSGRCPVCGRVYQWKLLNHVARDHQMALKPAHLSYKCTVCTATFGMYKQFESHVYSAHSVVAKRAMDTKKPPVIPPSSSSQNDALLKPLKINDEITIIPQPVRSSKPPNKPPTNSSASIVQKGKEHREGQELEDQACVRHEQNNQSEDDFEICTKECTLADFESESAHREHMLRHVRPVAVRLPRLDLNLFERMPDGGNGTYRLPKELPKTQDLRPYFGEQAEIISGGFRVELVNYTCLNEDCVYEVVRRDVNAHLLVPITTLLEVGVKHYGNGNDGGEAAAAAATAANGCCAINVGTIDLSGNELVPAGEPYVVIAPAMEPAASFFPTLPSVTQQQQQHRRRFLPPGVQEWATVTGMPAEYCQELLNTFGESHFILNNNFKKERVRQKYAPSLAKPSGTKSHQGPKKGGKSGLHSSAFSASTVSASADQIQGARSTFGTSDINPIQGTHPKFGASYAGPSWGTFPATFGAPSVGQIQGSRGQPTFSAPDAGLTRGSQSTFGAGFLESSKSAALAPYLKSGASSPFYSVASYSPTAPPRRVTSAANSTGILREFITSTAGQTFRNVLPPSSSSQTADPLADKTTDGSATGAVGNPASGIPTSRLPSDIISSTRSFSADYKIPKVRADTRVAKRTPLSVRQPSYVKVTAAAAVAAEYREKCRASSPSPVFVSVDEDLPPAVVPSGAGDIIDLLSDDEKGECGEMNELNGSIVCDGGAANGNNNKKDGLVVCDEIIELD